MIYLGIDHHKQWDQVAAINDGGEVVLECRVASTRDAWEQLKIALPRGESVCSVLEAGWNWGKLYDILEELGLHPKLANALKVRLIAESRIKTDKRDALALAQMLRMDWIPEVHVPVRETRDSKNLLRQRAWLIRQRTGIKNRIHSILDRNHLELPEISDVFGARGKAWLVALELRAPDDRLLNAHLDLFDGIQKQVRETERWIDEALKEHPDLKILMSVPGVGKLLGALIALEIDGIERFETPEKLCAYAGLVPSLHQSGLNKHHGGLISGCNRHLRYAFIEAAWTAVRVSPYFSACHRRVKAKKGSQVAIGAAARKLCVITFYCLRGHRNYIEKPYRFRPAALVVS